MGKSEFQGTELWSPKPDNFLIVFSLCARNPIDLVTDRGPVTHTQVSFAP